MKDSKIAQIKLISQWKGSFEILPTTWISLMTVFDTVKNHAKIPLAVQCHFGCCNDPKIDCAITWSRPDAIVTLSSSQAFSKIAKIFCKIIWIYFESPLGSNLSTWVLLSLWAHCENNPTLNYYLNGKTKNQLSLKVIPKNNVVSAIQMVINLSCPVPVSKNPKFDCWPCNWTTLSMYRWHLIFLKIRCHDHELSSIMCRSYSTPKLHIAGMSPCAHTCALLKGCPVFSERRLGVVSNTSPCLFQKGAIFCQSNPSLGHFKDCFSCSQLVTQKG